MRRGIRSVGFAMSEALAVAMRVASDPDNHTIACGCGAVFLSGACERIGDKVKCMKCGKLHPARRA